MQGPGGISMFHGVETKDDANSKDFLKKLRNFFRTSGIATDTDKIECFADHLATNSPAERWFDDPKTGKDTWADVQSGFSARFPVPRVIERTNEDIERELLGKRLKPGELGKRWERRGGEVWSHEAFADELLALAKEARIEETSTYIWKVREEFPASLRERVGTGYPTWVVFCAALKAVDGRVLAEVMEREREREEKIAAMERAQQAAAAETSRQIAALTAQLNALTTSSTGNIHRRPASGPQTTTRAPVALGSQNPSAGPTVSNDKWERLPEVVTEEMRRRTRELLELYPQQPNTPEGIREWKNQAVRWVTANPGERRSTGLTGFPLSPKARPVCSGECFKCGQGGDDDPRGAHLGTACPRPRTEWIPRAEGSWRAWCARVLGRGGAQRAVAVQMVEVMEDGDDDDLAFLGPDLAAHVKEAQGKA
ncbi:hypothetical protein CC2G_007912 [Coprinopsis cinerea AmutBmut pab1-1]|nr:hypothetical protein CC2G_007912 [Coprinopsis cinerea AmutBmut pab1-1]